MCCRCPSPKMATEPHPHSPDWREDMAALCEEMGIDQHAPCHDWREQLVALAEEMGVTNERIVQAWFV